MTGFKGFVQSRNTARTNLLDGMLFSRQAHTAYGGLEGNNDHNHKNKSISRKNSNSRSNGDSIRIAVIRVTLTAIAE